MQDPKTPSQSFLGELEHEQEINHTEAMEMLSESLKQECIYDRREREMDCE